MRRMLLLGALAGLCATRAARADELIVPEPGQIVKNPDLAQVKKNKWWPFGGTYWRVWGGSIAGSQPKGVSVTADGKVFLTNTGFHDHENVHRWDPDKLTVIAKVDFKGNAVESEVSPDGKILYVSNFYHQEMLALSTDDLHIVRRYKVGNVPKHFAVSPDGKTLYVSNWTSGTLSVVDVDKGTITRTIKVGKQPRGTAITRDGKKVYVTEFGSNVIAVIDTAKLEIVATIDPKCRAPRHAVATRDDRFILATCYGGNEMVVIDRNTDKIVRRVEVGRGPKTVDVSHDGNFAFTADYRNNTITFIDMRTWETKQVPLPVHKSSGVTVTADDARVYVTGWDSRNLIVIERLMPGIAPGKPSPKQATGKCERVPESECHKYP
ncbi:MAG TPA: YncE family protein [Kofleriaceae bacterium]|nr:YncE family protein [Kofleriaceae bacterium]